MARVTANVLIGHPGTGEPTVLLAGDEVPEWAAGLIGSHVLDAPGDPEGDPEGDKPAGNASLEEWRAYALANGKSEGDLDDLKRDEIRALFTD